MDRGSLSILEEYSRPLNLPLGDHLLSIEQSFDKICFFHSDHNSTVYIFESSRVRPTSAPPFLGKNLWPSEKPVGADYSKGSPSDSIGCLVSFRLVQVAQLTWSTCSIWFQFRIICSGLLNASKRVFNCYSPLSNFGRRQCKYIAWNRSVSSGWKCNKQIARDVKMSKPDCRK